MDEKLMEAVAALGGEGRGGRASGGGDDQDVNDSRRGPVEEPQPRAAYGLPEQRFVYCCFNNSHKLTPDVFAIWIRLSRRIEGSVLWLLADNVTFVNNLHRRAQAARSLGDTAAFARYLEEAYRTKVGRRAVP